MLKVEFYFKIDNWNRVAMKFRDNPKLLENITQVRKVLELMSDREFKNRYDVNEVKIMNNKKLYFILQNIK